MINNDKSTLLLYCCEDVKSHRSGGDAVPLNLFYSCVFVDMHSGEKVVCGVILSPYSH